MDQRPCRRSRHRVAEIAKREGKVERHPCASCGHAVHEVLGAEFVGTLPSELQNYVIYTAGVRIAVPDAAAERALIGFLMPEGLRGHHLEGT